MRPEDVELGPEAQRYIGQQNLEPQTVREVRATAGVLWRDEDLPAPDGEWLIAVGGLPDGRQLRMTCGPTPNHVASVRIVSE